MKHALLKLSLASSLLAMGYALGCVSSPQPSVAARKVEYKIINLYNADTPAIEGAFNSMAAEGWELVEWQRQPTAVFKR